MAYSKNLIKILSENKFLNNKGTKGSDINFIFFFLLLLIKIIKENIHLSGEGNTLLISGKIEEDSEIKGNTFM